MGIHRKTTNEEQKILMMAQESGEDVQLFQAMKGLVTACTFGKVDAENSPVFDTLHTKQLNQ